MTMRDKSPVRLTVRAQFSEWDKDGGGSIGYKELQKILARPMSPKGDEKKPQTASVGATGKGVKAAIKMAKAIKAPASA